jgi:PAT family beta-lactamase induction signal transducer AmpG
LLKQFFSSQSEHSWSEAFAVYLKRPVLVMLFLGFSAGLPFLLVFATLLTWLKKVNLDIAIIGYFSWIGITYSIKVFWAPVVDNLKIPGLTDLLGHRRSWMLAAQLGIATGLMLMAFTDPSRFPFEMACFALLVAFSSATQDVSIDAFRIEAAEKEFQAAMASTYILGYRLAVLVSSAGALYIAQYASWMASYLTMAGFVSVGVITVLLISEPAVSSRAKQLMPKALIQEYYQQFPSVFRIIMTIGVALFLIFFLVILLIFAFLFPLVLINSILTLLSGVQLINIQWLLDNYQMLLGALFIVSTIIALVVFLNNKKAPFKTVNDWVLGAVVGPFVDFFHRFGIVIAFMVLALISIYRISDIFMGSMAYTLYVDLGFELSEIANITKLFGFIMTLAGAALGGVLVMRFGIMRPLLVGALLVAVTTLLFSVLSTMGKDIVWLAIVIAADNISAGLAQSAFIAYLSALVNKSYTATQYALFSSLMTLLGKFLSGFSGEIVKADGYFNFFIYASLIGIPTILLIVGLIMLKHAPQPQEGAQYHD